MLVNKLNFQVNRLIDKLSKKFPVVQKNQKVFLGALTITFMTTVPYILSAFILTVMSVVNYVQVVGLGF